MSNFNEPWFMKWSNEHDHTEGFDIVDSTGKTRADDGSAGGEYSREMSEEAAERIIYCVNACAGLPTEKLIHQSEVREGLIGKSIFIVEQLDDVTEQRDKLLAVLEEIKNCNNKNYRQHQRIASAAIAEIKAAQ